MTELLRIVISFLISLCLSGQIQNLATDGSGQRVTFVTKLNLRMSGPALDEKIYVARPGEVSLFLLRERTGSTPDDANYYRLIEPEWTSDGSRMAFTGVRNCYPSNPSDLSYCSYFQQSAGWILGNSAETPIAPGHLRISANGKWGVTFGPLSYHSDPIIRDLESGESQPVIALNPLFAPPGRRVLAADGTLVVRADQGIVVQRGLTERLAIQPSLPTMWAIVSNDGRHIYYETIEDAPSIRHYDLDAATDEPIVEAVEGCRQPALSDDGHMLVFISAANWEARNGTLIPQAWAMDLRTGTLTQLTASTSPVREVTISGDGLRAWVLTDSQTVSHVDVLSRETQVAFAAQPVIDVPSRPQDLSPGSRYEFAGLGLDKGVLTIAGQALEPVERTGDRIAVIVPWELPTGETTTSLDDPDSPFAPTSLLTRVLPAAPDFWSQSRSDLRILEAWRVIGDTLTLITLEAPAEPGDLIEFHMTGLGPLDETGTPLHDIRWEDRINTPLEFVSAVRLDDGTYRARIRLGNGITIANYDIYCRALYAPNVVSGAYGWIPVLVP